MKLIRRGKGGQKDQSDYLPTRLSKYRLIVLLRYYGILKALDTQRIQ
jgi:hypothetical protein